VLRSVILPNNLSGSIDNYAFGFARSLRANQNFLAYIGAPGELANRGMEVKVVRKLIIDAEKVVLITGNTARACTHPDGLFRRLPQEPIYLVQMMDVL